ncbi:hypothetical protein H2200_010844 [Cladophialophora chaetospira]|uniref:Clr5 domain-containing protein n=1 Tax=Cladophialophora chaetospira TaxID=386627 RepID=A0AA39CDV1_9EURO|nr:hypothetical protein H2200_010844 [Cladophialophora chaetospira]
MTMTSPIRKRKRAPCDAEWDRIRPEFERLYIQECTSLPKISAILAQDYGFYAEHYMYKVRIAKWCLRKNFKNQELEAAASTVSHFVKAGLNAPQPIIDNRKVPIKRAKRHFKAYFKSDNILSPRTMATSSVNNYFAWRLTKTDDHFVAQYAGNLTLSTVVIDPGNLFGDIFVATCNTGAYHVLQASFRDTLVQMDTLLLQQHPSLIGTLVYHCMFWDEPTASRLMCHIFSYLCVRATKLLGRSHPISLTLKLLSDDRGQMRLSLLLRLMRDVASRQEEPDTETLFELEHSIARVCLEEDGPLVASELCQTLLQRYTATYEETHPFCRRLLRLLGEMNHRQGMNDAAKELMIRAIELDTSQHGEWTSIYAMETLAWISKKCRDLSMAKEWLSRAFEAVCNRPEAVIFIESFKWELDQVQRQLADQDDMSRPGERDLSEEDQTEVVKELQTQLAQMALRDTGKFEYQPARAETWTPWNNDLRSLNNDDTTTDRPGKRQGTLMEKAMSAPMDGLHGLTHYQGVPHLGTIKPIGGDETQPGDSEVESEQTLISSQFTQKTPSTQSRIDIPSGYSRCASIGTQIPPTNMFSATTIEQDMAHAVQRLKSVEANNVLRHQQDNWTNAFDLLLLDSDVQSGQVINEDGLDGSVASLPLDNTIPTFLMPQYFADFESYVDAVSIMGNDGLGTSGNIWGLDGDLDLQPKDFGMFEDTEAIDPKLIFPKDDAVGHCSTGVVQGDAWVIASSFGPGISEDEFGTSTSKSERAL